MAVQILLFAFRILSNGNLISEVNTAAASGCLLRLHPRYYITSFDNRVGIVKHVTGAHVVQMTAALWQTPSDCLNPQYQKSIHPFILRSLLSGTRSPSP